MTEEKIGMFRNRLTKVARHLDKQAKRLGVTCYRLYDHDLPEFPFCIERYEEKLYVAEYKRNHGMTDEEHAQWIEASLGAISDILKVNRENIFTKLRQRKPGRLGQYQKQATPVPGACEFIAKENGLSFLVNLRDYLDTGLFLDHRLTRQMVREQSRGKTVLNLFAYTGSFSVYAAAGEAAEVITVDLSNTYLQWAERNLRLNGFDAPTRYKSIQADVVQYLNTIPANHFEIVVMDPPTFSNSKRMDDFLDIQRDHVALINAGLRGLKPGGSLYFSTNFTRFSMDHEKINTKEIKDITKATTPFDFEGRLNRYCFLINK